MGVTERLARVGDRVFDRLRHRDAFAITESDAVERELEGLRGCKYAVLVTYKRDGTAVPSPVWVAVDGAGTAYVKTATYAGKTKRLRHRSRILIAPSNMRGKPIGPAIRGTARVLPQEEWQHAEQTLASAYGLGRQISERLLRSDESQVAYIAIAPRGCP